jgi:hypothetical protein
LFDRHKIISPSLFQTGHQSRLDILGQVDSFLEGIALHIAIKCFLEHVHLFIELARFLKHGSCGQTDCDFLEEILRKTYTVVVDDIGCFDWDPAFEVMVDGIDVISFILFDLTCFLFLTGFDQPAEIMLFKLVDILVVFLFCYFDGFIPFMEFLIHLHCLLYFIVLEEDRLCTMKLALEDSQFGLHFVV